MELRMEDPLIHQEKNTANYILRQRTHQQNWYFFLGRVVFEVIVERVILRNMLSMFSVWRQPRLPITEGSP